MARYQKPVLNLVADNVWGAACQAQRINGSYVKLSILTEEDKSSNKLSNRQMIETFMVDSSLITEEDMEQGKKVRAFYQALTFKILQGKQLNDFDNTAMLISNRDVITSNYDVAVIASLPSCYERGVVRQSADQRINFATGGLVGKAGDKVKLEIEVIKCTYSQIYNVFFVTGITTNDQPVFFSYKNKVPTGDTMNIYGTVKAHRDNITQLNRVNVL
jgi:catabolite regulation protein CreA